jgi:uncharacterized protein (TIGR03067 family)
MLDLDRLQGRWRQIRCDANGEENVSDEYGAAVVATIELDQFTVRNEEGTIVLHGAFVLDERTEPRSIDWIDAIGPDAGKRLPAIYELTETRFVFVAADAGMPRPTAFRAGAGEVLRSFVRVATGG